MFLVILDHFGIAEQIDGGMIRVRPLTLWFRSPLVSGAGFSQPHQLVEVQFPTLCWCSFPGVT